nr:ABC transporter G family member 11-like [Nicotiana tomentosiformis]
MKDLGELKYFIGIEFARSKQGILIHQRKYALELISETCLATAKPVTTPLDFNMKLTIREYDEHIKKAESTAYLDEELKDQASYQKLIGPASASGEIELFGTNGFPFPTLQNPSDHFLKIINKDFDEGGEKLEKNKPCKLYYAIMQSLILTRRSSVNMFRDIGYYWMQFASYIVITLGLGSIYYNVDSCYGSIEERGLMVAFVVSSMTFMTIGGFPSFVEYIKEFQRENMNGYYDCCAFVIGNTLSSMAYLLLISLVPGAIAYFLAGFQMDLGILSTLLWPFSPV